MDKPVEQYQILYEGKPMWSPERSTQSLVAKLMMAGVCGSEITKYQIVPVDRSVSLKERGNEQV